MIQTIRRLWYRWQAGGEVLKQLAHEGPTDEPTHLDRWRTTRKPTAEQLVRAHRETAYTLAGLNAAAVAASTIRLFAVRPQPQRMDITRELTPEMWRRLSGESALQRKLANTTGRQDVREVTDHPLLDLLEAPNPDHDGYTFLEFVELYLEMTGIAYVHMIIDRTLGIPKALWVLPTQHVRIERSAPKGPVTRYWFANTSLRPEDLIVFRMPSLEDPYAGGKGPAEAAYQTLNLMFQDASWATALLENRAQPDYIVWAEDGIGKPEARRLERRISQRFRRAGLGGVAVFGGGGKFELKPLNFSAKDLMADKRHKITKTELYNAYGVPIALGEGEQINRATLEAANRQHKQYAIRPRLTRLVMRLNQRIVQLYGDNLFLWYDDPVPDDVEQEARIRKADLESAHRTINETREVQGLEPVEWGQRPWIPARLRQPGDDVREHPDSSAEEVRSASLSEQVQERVYGVLTARLDAATRYTSLRQIGCSEQQAAAWAAVYQPIVTPIDVDAKTDGHGRRLPTGSRIREVLLGVFAGQRVDVVRHLQIALRTIYGAKANLSEVDLSAWDSELARRAFPAIVSYAERGAAEVQTRLGISEAFSIVAPEVREALDAAAFRFAESTNRATQLTINEAVEKLRQDLAAGIIESDNVPRELSRIVNQTFTDLERWKADRIALTESSRAVHLGQRMAAEKSGLVTGFKWLLSADPCPICIDIASRNPDGIALSGSFGRVGNSEVYAEVQHPPAHPHCMCTMTEILVQGDGGVPDDVAA